MKRITHLPKYAIGQVIDLSYKNGGLPNRIYIRTVYMREFDKHWMYDVFMENTGTRAVMDEVFLSERECHKTYPVYKLQKTKNSYSDGFRFCGNYDMCSAESQASLISQHENVKNVVLFPALAGDGKLLKSQYGVWIRYNTIIDDDGNIMVNGMLDDIVKVIK